jgi:hypothetical protein
VRDIRPDLKDRLADIKARREEMQSELRRLADQEAAVERLLLAEESKWRHTTPSLFDSEPQPQQMTLSQLLLDSLKSRNEAASLGELKEEAVRSGVPFGRKKPGRAIHFAMLGMAQHNLVERTKDGKWSLKKRTFGS